MENSEEYKPKMRLRLYVSGASPNSLRAIANIKKICESKLDHTYELEIIDVYQQPLLVKNEQLVALPLLLKMSPLPVKKLIGDMSDQDKVCKGLGLDN